ncbi:molybdopterin molybdotransferase MoeA [Picrophilus oshimae]|uniref:Molybdopterin biosynthesis MoeA protein n=1 Tax=Picrophilus torridus (strain ATCC 700027 / DSM 9790 / JCM 10055 / NBRC 100828 / KAW 2/3) TaxID=1122961 RepID=Q6KZH6_PICTO|nr:molybdopterin molybdotransferase MoeA [Picrophilus oshimae]AAT43876.1 molybdopterin biosynthesis MoeA protein [Picrophilus oshimae DSM 9789]
MKRIMRGFENFISYNDALGKISMKLKIKTETLCIASALNRISASDVLSNEYVPDNDKSAVDGYAIISDDTMNASIENPARLDIKYTVRPGQVPGSIDHGECAEVYTGSYIPINSNAVVKAEDTENHGDSIMVYRHLNMNENISKMGEDLYPGFNIIKKDSLIEAQHIAAMEAVKIEKIDVYKKIKLCIINTGDEVYYNSVRNSTGYMLKSFYSMPYIDVIGPFISRDDKDEIMNIINKNINNCDIMIITGGSSIGRYDLVGDVLSGLGKCIFSGVSIKPGRTVSLFNLNGRPVISCSGLPVAALISSYFIISKIIKNTFNISIEKPISGRLSSNVSNRIGFTKFQICRTYISDNNVIIEPLKTTGSGLISSVIKGNSFIIINDGLEGIAMNSIVMAYLIGDVKWA